MSSLRAYLFVTLALFVLLTVAHVVRAATGTPVVFGATTIAPALSWPFALVTALLAGWALRLAQAASRP